MALPTTCQTPGTMFTTSIRDGLTKGHVDVRLVTPKPLDLSEAEAELLEANIHNALELVMAKYFSPKRSYEPYTLRTHPEFGPCCSEHGYGGRVMCPGCSR